MNLKKFLKVLRNTMNNLKRMYILSEVFCGIGNEASIPQKEILGSRYI